jgi:integrase
VPLSSRALEILAVAAEIRTGEYAFPGRNSKRPLSSMVFLMLLRRMGRGDLTAHGFRSSFRDWAGDKTTFPRDVAEMALAHAVGDKTERAYRREDALAKRRKLMDAWARFCGSAESSGVVVPLRSASN